ncbi:hypothetical protein SAMN05660337_1044 [Maridesulfovibrio ferrireducens]|uniref:Uncharacterized protein n=1 Tax=Maridesulfovibrio ferrireducens TaxID=246191 RepID=A0A1G9ECD0_9BACT|nr:hypothetical protein [Maridesulfovibrio ferrireducens]SDK73738.1 hypothetical protein SAMN05660337_1044 [Maridesulfovibrio ferrireducens]
MLQKIKRINVKKIPWGKVLVIAYALIIILGAWPTKIPYYIKGHEVGPLGRWALVTFGFFILGCVFFYKPSKKRKMFTKQEKSICPMCEKVFMLGQAPKDQNCPKCTYPLEPLKGFYDRHPELKDIKSENN